MTLLKFGLVMLLVMALLTACDDDEAVTTPAATLDGIKLLGLVDGRALQYQQDDTVITLVPEYQVTVSSRIRTFTIQGASEDWLIREGDDSLVNLKVSPPYVLHNGFWGGSASDSIKYYPTPSIVMQSNFASVKSWSGVTPPYADGINDIAFPYLNIYFGFHYSRTYVGKESLLLPSGAYTAYRFDVELYFGAADSSVDALATEWYEPTVGLVKLTFNGQGLNRTLSLVEMQ